jgi:hypothetical protein
MSIVGHFSDLTGLADEIRFWPGKADFSDASADFRKRPWIAVGMPVAGHPPHRSGQARFEHPALTLGV